jgi:ribosomal protein L24
MFKSKVCKGDKVIIIKGSAAQAIDPDTKQPLVCTVLKMDRSTGRALLDVPRTRDAKKKERETPRKGVEQWKTARYNQKTGEAGGLKVVKKPVHVSNLKIVEKGPARQFGK